jgi:hypothetical protein
MLRIDREHAGYRSRRPTCESAKCPVRAADTFLDGWENASGFARKTRLAHQSKFNDCKSTRTMDERLDAIRSLDDLRAFVHATLCGRENILPDQFGLSETALTRNGNSCGLQFCLHGPRSIWLEAIWVADRNVLYFYDARGVRFLKLQLRQRLCSCAA